MRNVKMVCYIFEERTLLKTNERKKNNIFIVSNNCLVFKVQHMHAPEDFIPECVMKKTAVMILMINRASLDSKVPFFCLFSLNK